MAGPVAKERISTRGRARYEDDLYTWILEQVGLLRDGRLENIDAMNIAEELSDLGAEQYDKLERPRSAPYAHAQMGPSGPTAKPKLGPYDRGAAAAGKESRPQIAPCGGDRGRLKLGRICAAREMRIEPDTLPSSCPYDWDAIMHRPFEAERSE